MKFFSFFLLLILYCCSHTLYAQLPQQIHYQAIARDGESGAELQNQTIDVAFTVLDGGAAGSAEYQELHSTLTNEYGLVNLQIGGGEPLFGDFSAINWGESQKWLRVEMDLGDGLEEVSVSQFISVPYALHAAFAQTVVDVDDADADPFNELVDSLVLVENILYLYQPEMVLSVDLSSLIADNDDDPTNELIEDGSFQLQDTLLSFTEGGITHIVNLAPLANYGPWLVGNGSVYNTTHRIGIGTDTAQHKLHVTNESDEDSVAVFASAHASTGTNVGVYSIAEGSTDNRAIYGDAPGAGGTNWAGYFDRGNVKVANKLSVGTDNLNAQLSVSGQDTNQPIVEMTTAENEPAVHVSGEGYLGLAETSPHSRLHVNGSVAGKVRFVSAAESSDIILTANDYLLIVNISAGPVAVNLPAAASCEGRIYYIKRTFDTPTANTLAINSAPGDSIDGTALPILLSSISTKESRMLVSAGSHGWFIMSE